MSTYATYAKMEYRLSYIHMIQKIEYRVCVIPVLRLWFDQCCMITGKRCETGGKLVLFTHRKSHTGFQLVPKSMTLKDFKRRVMTAAQKRFPLISLAYIFQETTASHLDRYVKSVNFRRAKRHNHISDALQGISRNFYT